MYTLFIKIILRLCDNKIPLIRHRDMMSNDPEVTTLRLKNMNDVSYV
jgi:hypothetical protein